MDFKDCDYIKIIKGVTLPELYLCDKGSFKRCLENDCNELERTILESEEHLYRRG